VLFRFSQVLQFPPPIKLTATIEDTKILCNEPYNNKNSWTVLEQEPFTLMNHQSSALLVAFLLLYL